MNHFSLQGREGHPMGLGGEWGFFVHHGDFDLVEDGT